MNQKQPESARDKFSFDERRKAVRKFRKEAGLTQAELAAMAHVHESTISRFESGSRDLSRPAFEGVQEALVTVLSDRLATLHESRGGPRLYPLSVLSGPRPDAPFSDVLVRKATQRNLDESPRSLDRTSIESALAVGTRIAELRMEPATANRARDRAIGKMQDIASRSPDSHDLVVELWAWIAELEGHIAQLEDELSKLKAGKE